MQSYTDLIVLAIIAGALLLLMLLLTFFILLHRRCAALERDNEALSSDLTELKLKLSNVQNENLQKSGRLQQEAELISKRLNALDTQLSFLQKTQDECIDSLNELKDKQGELKAEQQVQQLLIEKQADPDHEALQQAKELIEQGISLDKVQEITAMPSAELEMLKSVQQSRKERTAKVLGQDSAGDNHPAAAPAAKTAAQGMALSDDPAPASDFSLEDFEQKRKEALSRMQRAEAEASVGQPAPAPAQPVASWKAREAYGMKSLRSRR